MQIRHKLALQFILISGILICLALFLIYIIFANQLRSEFYKGLESKALMTAEMLVKHNSLQPDTSISGNNQEVDLPAKEKVIIYNSRYEKVYAFNKNDVVPEFVLKNIDKNKNLKFKVRDYEALGIKYRNKLNEDYILVCQGMFFSDDLKGLRNVLITVFFIVISFIGFGGYLFAKQALSPINDLMNQMDEVYPAQIGKRLEFEDNKDELSRLATMFNNLLDRAEEAYLNQKGFLSNISHEIKNPLTAIITRLDVLLQHERTNAEYRTEISSTLADMQEMKDVAEQLMQLARITSGNESGIFQNLRLDELVWQSKANLLRLHPDYHFKMEANELPDNPEQLEIRGNENLLKTAISNLLSNACKFSSDQTATMKIFSPEQGKVQLDIKDKGAPIPEEEQKLIFKPFYRSPSKRHIKGTGIGLPLVLQILKMHNAELKLHSIENKGNCFSLIFNIASAANAS
ncbi:MAG: HAMP domain-containing histidine kinase [Saprospiraceae bacterium]|nr:HAMP domain-containing histidine kinase [Saprospiraceae bacterium]